jgi:glycogen operon protein
MLATLLLSEGTPMLLGGDELGRTQRGNNNAYCQDNDISWFDWNLDDRANQLLAFTKKLVQLRRNYPILRRSRFFTGQHDEQLDISDVTWINTDGDTMQPSDWDSSWAKCFGMLLDGRCRKTAMARHGGDETVLVVMNSYEDGVNFKLPHTSAGSKWLLLLDTNCADTAPDQRFDFECVHEVTGRSLQVFTASS